MKNYLNLTISGIFSVLTFIFFALPTLVNEFGATSGYSHICFNSGFDFIAFFGFFGLILLLLNLIILIFVILKILNKLNVFKLQFNFNRILLILTIIATALSAMCLITNIISAINIGMSIGVCSIFILIIYTISLVARLFIKEPE